ncbi:hypothetical protein A3A79_04980 [Candidatus Gottesmanbacteria bacterium RIFCSPLOWO2_01_FULL_43_11b]|uniref:Glycosyltransferase RgtA/B/C/D-like domain-containing protein n=1 Tax=Candidatus Gottesmanbacteria bacterium RIFCSPLOWO2_01_FULL_43_11b TaxID=1798392 RepID=A0A1F6AIH9_9BACT|nr:MAG: hypothetical protein A3A79_04980 [Candidatus Gottesmanbacteria bacterium RIFCSPLOWO2_01_FULL_43_11b]
MMKKRTSPISYLVIIIMIIALVVRFVGIKPGFPPLHADEPTSYSTAIYMNLHNFEPDYFFYGAGMPLIHAILYRTIIIPIRLIDLFIRQPQSLVSFISTSTDFFVRYGVAIFGRREVYAMFWSRAIAALFGSATVLLVYFTGKRLFNKSVGLFTAFFLAVNYRHVLGSHFGLPDIHNSFFAVLSLYAASLILEKRTILRYVFAGVSAGLSFSIKYQPFAFFPLLVAHTYWTVKQRQLFTFIGAHAWIAVISFIVTFLVINPYFLFNVSKVISQNAPSYQTYQIGELMLRPYGYFYLFHWGIGELPSVIVVLGALLMLWKKRLNFLLIGSYAFIFLLFMTYVSGGGIYTRNYIPPIPFLMLFAGYGLWSLVSVLPKHGFGQHIAIWVLLILINFYPIKNVIVLDMNYLKPWGPTVLEDWIDKKLPEEIRLRAHQLFLNDKGTNALKRKNVTFLNWDWRDSKGANSLTEFVEEGTDFVIIRLSLLQLQTYGWRQFPKKEWFFKYNSVPYDYILNSYYGLTLRELLPYTVSELYKPWQAPEHGFLVFKIPRKVNTRGRSVDRQTFLTDDALWRSVNPFDLGSYEFSWFGEGFRTPGSIRIEGESGDSTARLSSEPIIIEPGQHYTVTGWLRNTETKANPDQEKEPDGFLRIDFYADGNTNVPISLGVGLSARVLPDNIWHQVQVSTVAPAGARVMTISFQKKDPILPYTTFVDDIEVYESQPPPEQWLQIPYIKSTIQWKDVFYPGFL